VVQLQIATSNYLSSVQKSDIIVTLVKNHFEFRPKEIIRQLVFTFFALKPKTQYLPKITRLNTAKKELN